MATKKSPAVKNAKKAKVTASVAQPARVAAKKAAAKPAQKKATATAKKAAPAKAPAKKATAAKKAVAAKTPEKKAVVKKAPAKTVVKKSPAKKATPVSKKASVTEKKVVGKKTPMTKKTATTGNKSAAAPKKAAAKATGTATKKAVVKKAAPAKKAAPVAKTEVTKKAAAPKKVAAKTATATKAVAKKTAVKAAPAKKATTSKAAGASTAARTVAKAGLPVMPKAQPAVAKPAPVVPSRAEKKPTVVVAHRRMENKSKKTDDAGKTMINYQPEFTRSILDEPRQSGPVYRYSDEELGEFKELIMSRLETARKELVYLQGLITRKDEAGTEDTENRYMNMEDGSGAMEREQLAQLASRQIQFINHLEKALIRIENKTYGICRVTGQLIDKARLRAVPHATLSIEAKKTMNK